VETNAGFLTRLLGHHEFLDGQFDTGFIARHESELVPQSAGGVDPIMVALAALAITLDRRARAHAVNPHSPFARLDGFRMNLTGAESLKLVHHEHALAVTIHQDPAGTAIQFDGKRFALAGTLDGDGALDAVIDGVRHRAAVHFSAGRVTVLAGGV